MQKQMKLESQFPKQQTCWELVERLSRNRHPNVTKNEQVYAICCRPEVAGDVISRENMKTLESYAALNFEVASFSSFRDIPPKIISFRLADIDDSIKRKRIRVSLNEKRWETMSIVLLFHSATAAKGH